MEKILCDHNLEYVYEENATCSIRLISREKTVINIYGKVKKEVRDLSVNLNLFDSTESLDFYI
jgi:hypothetical protein